MPKDIFEHFGLDNRGQRAQQEAGPSVADLQKQLAELQATNERLQRDTQTLLNQRPTVPVQQERREAPTLDLSGLPDPYSDLEGYNKAFAERVKNNAVAEIRGELDQRQTAAQQQAAQQARVDQLWRGFEEAYPDLAKNRDLIEFVAGKVVNDAVARNIDPDRYIFGTTETFYADVERAALALNPALAPKPAVVEEEELGIFTGGPGSEGRTAGIPGGQESFGKPSAGAAEEKPGDMVKDLQAIQRASGFF